MASRFIPLAFLLLTGCRAAAPHRPAEKPAPLARAHWGQGFATEAARAVRDYAFETLRLPRLVALIDPGNVRSIRVAERIGLRYDRDAMLEGYDHPDRLYSLNRPGGS